METYLIFHLITSFVAYFGVRYFMKAIQANVQPDYTILDRKINIVLSLLLSFFWLFAWAVIWSLVKTSPEDNDEPASW